VMDVNQCVGTFRTRTIDEANHQAATYRFGVVSVQFGAGSLQCNVFGYQNVAGGVDGAGG
jgi:hypothetical protein